MNTRRADAVRFVVGSRWASDTRLLLERDAFGDHAATFDIDSLKAPLDLVLDGRNVTSFLPDERVLPFMRRLCAGLAELHGGGRSRLLVEFEESPWELAILRSGPDDVAIWLYEISAPGRVEIEDVTVGLSSIVLATRRAMERMLDDARDLPVALATDQLLDELRTSVAELQVHGPPAPPPRRRTARAPELLRVDTVSSEAGAIRIELRPAGHAIADYDGEHADDRHVLLAPGMIAFEPPDARSIVLGNRPLLVLEALVESVLDWLAHPPRDRSRPRRILRTISGDLSISTDGVSAELSLWEGSMARWTAAAPYVDVLCLIADHAVDTLRRIREVNPLLDVHQRLLQIDESARHLRGLVVRSSAPGPRLHDLGSAPALTREQELDRGSSFPFSLAGLRKIRFEKRWEMTRDGIDVSRFSVVAAEERLLRTRETIERLDVRAGKVSWAVRVAPHTGTVGPLVAGELVASLDSPREIVVRRLADGKGLFTHTVASPLRSIVSAWSGEVDGQFRLLFLTSDASLSSHDPTGMLLWKISLRCAPCSMKVFAGVATISGEGGELMGVDAASGQLRWERADLPGAATLTPFGDGLVVAASDALEGLFGMGELDVRDGRWRWFDEGIGDVIDVVVDADHAAILVAEADVRHALILGADGAGPRARVAYNGSPVLTRSWIRISDGILISTESETVRAFDVAEPDRVLWTWEAPERVRVVDRSTCPGLFVVSSDAGITALSVHRGTPVGALEPFWEDVRWLEVDRRGHLTLIEGRLRARATIHGIEAVGLLAAVQ